MRIAFLGLGIMGRPMASRLVAAGHDVSVWNRTARQHVEGATTAVSPAEAAKEAEVVWSCVADTASVERVMFGDDGAVPCSKRGGPKVSQRSDAQSDSEHGNRARAHHRQPVPPAGA